MIMRVSAVVAVVAALLVIGSTTQSFTGVDASHCAAGQFQNATMACEQCAIGTYTPFANHLSSCLDCPIGTTTNSTHGYACLDKTPCPAGYASNSTTSYIPGEPHCGLCGIGTYAASNSTSCSTCSAGSYSLPPTTPCTVCEINKFVAPNGTCLDCPTGSFSTPGSIGVLECKLPTTGSGANGTNGTNATTPNATTPNATTPTPPAPATPTPTPATPTPTPATPATPLVPPIGNKATNIVSMDIDLAGVSLLTFLEILYKNGLSVSFSVSSNSITVQYKVEIFTRRRRGLLQGTGLRVGTEIVTADATAAAALVTLALAQLSSGALTTALIAAGVPTTGVAIARIATGNVPVAVGVNGFVDSTGAVTPFSPFYTPLSVSDISAALQMAATSNLGTGSNLFTPTLPVLSLPLCSVWCDQNCDTWPKNKCKESLTTCECELADSGIGMIVSVCVVFVALVAGVIYALCGKRKLSSSATTAAKV